MIAQIRGRLIQKSPGAVVVDAGGIGYQLFISLVTFYDLPEAESPVQLYAHTYVREDLLQLYGFSTPLEKELFQILIGVSGIGPKLALNLLSGMAPPELLRCLEGGHVHRLLSIPGVGRKTAERLVLDLQEKAGRLGARRLPAPAGPRTGGLAEDVLSALLNLGYKKSQADEAVQKVLAAQPGAGLEEVLRASLQALAKR